MKPRIEEVPLTNGCVQQNGNAAGMSSPNGHHRSRLTSSISVPPKLQLTLAWKDIGVTHSPGCGLISRLRCDPPPATKTILKGVSGVANPGTLTALMGSSGAGKTTLLNVLNQRGLSGLNIKGHVYLNGIPIGEYGRSTSKLIGYVQQHDILPGELTVREYLTFCAILTMSRHVPEEAKLAKVEELLNEFSLKKCADTMIRGAQSVSGGERKRVSVATKLFAEPKLLFLDEPTTGLDSYMAALLVQNLRDLAAQGYNIICTIHQPSADVFKMFDQLLLLANGRISYFGPQLESLSYFSRIGYRCPDDHSPADYFIQLLATVPGREASCHARAEKIANEYKKSSYTEKSRERLAIELTRHASVEDFISEDQEIGYQTSWFKQLSFITWRGFIYLRRNPALLKTRVLFVAFMCLIIALMYWNPIAYLDQSRVTAIRGLLYFFCANFTFVNSSRILVILPQELPLMIREHLDGMYSLSAYYIGTFVSQCSLGITLMILSVTAVYFVGGLVPEADTFFICILILALSYLVNVGFVAMQSSIWEKPHQTISITTPLIFVLNVVGGFFINPRSINPYLLPILYIDWVPWAYELLNINQWQHIESIDCEWSNQDACLTTGEMVMNKYGFSKDDATSDYLLIAGQVVAYHLLTFLILKLKMKYKWSN